MSLQLVSSASRWKATPAGKFARASTPSRLRIYVLATVSLFGVAGLQRGHTGRPARAAESSASSDPPKARILNVVDFGAKEMEALTTTMATLSSRR